MGILSLQTSPYPPTYLPTWNVFSRGQINLLYKNVVQILMPPVKDLEVFLLSV